MTIHEKPDFVYTGQKDFFDVKFYNSEKKAKLDSYGNYIAFILLDNSRIDVLMRNPLSIVEYAKRKIVAKGKRGARNAYGNCKIFFIDEETGKDFTAATIDMQRTRYYEPIERFNHEKD